MDFRTKPIASRALCPRPTQVASCPSVSEAPRKGANPKEDSADSGEFEDVVYPSPLIDVVQALRNFSQTQIKFLVAQEKRRPCLQRDANRRQQRAASRALPSGRPAAIARDDRLRSCAGISPVGTRTYAKKRCFGFMAPDNLVTFNVQSWLARI